MANEGLKVVLTFSEFIGVQKWLELEKKFKSMRCPFRCVMRSNKLCFRPYRSPKSYHICVEAFPRVATSHHCPCVCYTHRYVVQVAKRMLKDNKDVKP